MTMMRVRRTPLDSLDEVTAEHPFPVEVVTEGGASVNAPINKLSHNQVSVGTSATLIRAANAKRREILITQITGSQIVYLGTTQGVSSSNSQYLGSSAGNAFRTTYRGDMWGIAATSAQTVSWAEEEED